MSHTKQHHYEIAKYEVLYQGMFRMARYTLRYRLFNGEWSDFFSREVMERKSAAAILPYDPTLDLVVLIEQFRVGAIAPTQGPWPIASPWLIEIVAGVLDKPTDQPEAVATREANEEAGCEILDIYPICEYFVSPGGSNEYIQLFCGKIDASQAGGIFGLQEENENIRTLVLPTREAIAMLKAGKVNTSPAIISLQWLQANNEIIKNYWTKTG